MIASSIGYVEVAKHIPGLTRYRYLEARKMKSNANSCTSTVHVKERYSRQKLTALMDFITRFQYNFTDKINVIEFQNIFMACRMASDKLNCHLVDRMTIANTLRLQTNSEIVAMYKKYMDGTGQDNLKFSDSTITRILQACPAEKRKSIQGLDYFIADGLEVCQSS